MPFTDLTPLPEAPQRSDEPEIFIEKADAFVAALEVFSGQLNTFIAELETAAALIAAAPAYSDPGLVALTGNTPAANKLAYYTGAGSSALATFTDAARSLLDDANVIDMLTTLGFSAFVKTIIDGADEEEVRGSIDAAKSGDNVDITSLAQSVTIADEGGITADSIGFRGLPANAKTAAYELVLDDSGKHVSITTGGVTIPANASVAFEVGTAIVIYNDSGMAQAIAITTDTLRWGGTTSTGPRTLLAYGVATLLKVGATTWVVTGNVV